MLGTLPTQQAKKKKMRKNIRKRGMLIFLHPRSVRPKKTLKILNNCFLPSIQCLVKLTKCSNLFFVGFKEKVEQQIDKKKIKNEGGVLPGGGFKLI